ncbi:unnamed protein product [Effrenium voratum]|uniref:Uncharacterized protein n=1 Tax=Effrenium voratum TaxID=2562239 RepID=A0AA36NAC1_9DINO|nr:unnamed protein product [Effrenium voratum]
MPCGCKAPCQGKSPDAWVIRKTFVEVSQEEVQEEGRRASSEPPLRRASHELEAATDDVQQLKQMIAEAQAEAKDLESQCEIALPPKSWNSASLEDVQHMEQDLGDLLQRVDAANMSLCSAHAELQRLQGRAAPEDQIQEEYAAKMEENQELEEECARLQEEVAAAKADMSSAKRKAPRAKGRAAPPAPPALPAPPAPSPAMLEAHRRRTEALLALSEARVAASRAATDADEAEQAAEQLGVELEEKEEQMKAAVAQAEQSLAAEEGHFVDQLQAVDDQLQHMGRCRKDLQHRCAVRKGILDKCRSRRGQMASKVARAEGRASAMQADAEMEAQELRHLKDRVEQFKGLDGTLAAAKKQFGSAERLWLLVRLLLLTALLCGILSRFC